MDCSIKVQNTAKEVGLIAKSFYFLLNEGYWPESISIENGKYPSMTYRKWNVSNKFFVCNVEIEGQSRGSDTPYKVNIVEYWKLLCLKKYHRNIALDKYINHTAYNNKHILNKYADIIMSHRLLYNEKHMKRASYKPIIKKSGVERNATFEPVNELERILTNFEFLLGEGYCPSGICFGMAAYPSMTFMKKQKGLKLKVNVCGHDLGVKDTLPEYDVFITRENLLRTMFLSVTELIMMYESDKQQKHVKLEDYSLYIRHNLMDVIRGKSWLKGKGRI